MDKIKQVVFLLLGILFCAEVVGQGDTARVYSFGGAAEDEARAIIQTSDMGYLLVGSTSSFGNGNSDIYVLKLSSDFQIEWSNVYGGPQVEWAESVVQTPDGGYLIVGATNWYGNGGYDCYFVKIESDGAFEYEETYGGSDWDFFHKAILLSNGDALLLGETTNTNNGRTEAFAVRINPFGIDVWEKSYPGDGSSIFRSAHLKGSNEVLITGASSAESDSLDFDIYLASMAYDGSLNAEYFYGGDLDEEAFDIELFNNETYLAGYSRSTSLEGDENEYLLRLDASYSVVWERNRKFNTNGANLDKRTDASRIYPCNDTFMTGVTYTFGSGKGDVIISHLESSGYEYPTSGSIGGNEEDIGFDLLPRGDSGLVIVGRSKNYGSPYSNVYLMVMDTIRRITQPNNPSQVKYINLIDTLPASQPNSIRQLSILPDQNEETINDFLKSSELYGTCSVIDIQGRVLALNLKAEDVPLTINSFQPGIYSILSSKDRQMIRFRMFGGLKH